MSTFFIGDYDVPTLANGSAGSSFFARAFLHGKPKIDSCSGQILSGISEVDLELTHVVIHLGASVVQRTLYCGAFGSQTASALAAEQQRAAGGDGAAQTVPLPSRPSFHPENGADLVAALCREPSTAFLSGNLVTDFIAEGVATDDEVAHSQLGCFTVTLRPPLLLRAGERVGLWSKDGSPLGVVVQKKRIQDNSLGGVLRMQSSAGFQFDSKAADIRVLPGAPSQGNGCLGDSTPSAPSRLVADLKSSTSWFVLGRDFGFGSSAAPAKTRVIRADELVIRRTNMVERDEKVSWLRSHGVPAKLGEVICDRKQAKVKPSLRVVSKREWERGSK